MAKLGEEDTRSVLDAATSLAADTPGFVQVLEMLAGMISCKMASFNDMTLATRDYRALTWPPEFDATSHRLKPAYDRFAHQHPLIQLAGTSVTTGALRFCDAADGDKITETDLYRHFYEPFGLRYQLILQLPSPPDVVVGYALSRSEAAGEFSDRDVAVLDSIAPHLAMHHRATVNDQHSAALADEVRRSGWNVASVRSDGVVDAMSTTAGDPPVQIGDRVPCAVAQLLPSGDDVDEVAHSQTVVLGDEVWRCVVRPMAAGPTVLLMRPADGDANGSSSLVDVGLTGRQVEVAMALARTGATNVQLAREPSITEGTVKKHLETVFAALGVDSRSAAIVKISQLTATAH